MKIYTKSGDKGVTSLANGVRVSKAELRLETYGTADELNAHFGVLQSMLADTEGGAPYAGQILWVQNKLFNLGAMLSSAPGEWITDADVQQLEKWIDEIQETLPVLRAFTLPTGSVMIATAHVCRTVTRRLERLMVRLDENEPEPNMPVALKFVNRLSDFCYVLARKSVILQKKEPFVWKK